MSVTPEQQAHVDRVNALIDTPPVLGGPIADALARAAIDLARASVTADKAGRDEVSRYIDFAAGAVRTAAAMLGGGSAVMPASLALLHITASVAALRRLAGALPPNERKAARDALTAIMRGGEQAREVFEAHGLSGPVEAANTNGAAP